MGVAQTAKSYVGKVKYVFGADNIPGGQGDCSSFTQYVYKQNGYNVGRTTLAQVEKGKVVDKSKLEPGDMVFFQGTYRKGVSHVGVYIGGGKFCHNSSSKGVVISNLSDSYYTQHWMQGRRIEGANSGTDTGGTTEGTATGTENKKASKAEIAYLKRLAKTKAVKASTIEGTIKKDYNHANVSIKIIITNGSQSFEPVLLEGLSLDLVRSGTPGKLSFKLIKDAALKIEEGNAVRVTVDGNKLFYGFIFAINRTNENTMSITAYNQLRYLKNKDTYMYKKKTASQVIRMIAKDFQLNCGTLVDTKYVIGKKIEEDQTLFDIIQNALDDTFQYKNKLYVLFDDFGKLALKDISSMKVNCVIDKDTAESFDYQSSIDSNVYNKIKIKSKTPDKKNRSIWVKHSLANMKKWGTLQFFETVEDPAIAELKATVLLKQYNQKQRTLSVKGAFGDYRVKAGSSVPIMLNLGDITVKNYMVVENVKHNFNNREHTMDLTLRGGLFDA